MMRESEESDFWSKVGAAVAEIRTNYVRLGEEPEFDMSHRRAAISQILKLDVELPSPPVDADLIGTSTELFTLFLNGYDTIIGVPKKGVAVLREIRDRIGTDFGEVFSTDELGRINLQDRNVVIFDDTIHEGNKLSEVISLVKETQPKSIVALVLWSSDEGITAIKDSHPDVRLIEGKAVPEDLFWLSFQLFVIPLLYSLKTGAVTNRVFDYLEVQHEAIKVDSAIQEILTVLCDLPCVQNVVENAPLDRLTFETFHGSLEMEDGVTATLLEKINDEEVEMEYAKIRIILYPGNPIRLTFVGCPSPIGICPGQSCEDAENLDAEIARALLNLLWSELEPELNARRYKYVRRECMPNEMPT